MKKYYIYIKTVLFLLILGGVFSFTSHRNKKRIVSDVKVSFSNEDNLFLTHQMVNNLLVQNENHVVNKQKTLINLQELEHNVELHPMVSSAEVSVGITGDLQVSVKQRKPIARMFNVLDVVYIDTKGEEMPLSKNYSARVLIIDNKNSMITHKEIFPLIKKINDDTFLKKLIIAIRKDKQGYWFLTRFNQQKILLGNLKNSKRKLKKLKVFYGYIEKDSLAHTFKKIDLQYNNQVVCSK